VQPAAKSKVLCCPV